MILISNCCFSNYFQLFFSLFVNVIHKTYYWFIDVFLNGKYIYNKMHKDLLCSNRTVIEDIMVSMYEEIHSSMITVYTKVSN